MGKTPKDTSDARPDIATITDSVELRRWYWRKDELVPHARTCGVKTTGGKFLILDRISHFLDTGETVFPGDQTVKPKSNFDWHCEPLSDDTIITDSYKNSQNVRRYFKSRLGDGFKFNIAFMDWMRANTGKTLADACAAFPTLKQPSNKTKIRDHNQFNQYTRDFLADNPTLTLQDVRAAWAAKIQRPSDTGRHVYERSDLAFLAKDDTK